MRNFFGSILIIIFVLASFFALRNDLLPVWQKVQSFASTFIGVKGAHDSTSSATPLETIPTAAPIGAKQDSSSKTIVPKVSTPGPLKVSESHLALTDATPLIGSEIIADTNIARKTEAKLPPLTENAKLDMSASAKVDDMFAKQYFEHVSPSGKGVTDLATDVSYAYVVIGENLALGNFASSPAGVDAWMARPGHRANILNKRYTEIGVSAKEGMYQGNKVWLAVQHFGRPLDSCPAVDMTLKTSIETQKANLDILFRDLETRRKEIESIDQNGGEYDQKVQEYNALRLSYQASYTDVNALIQKYNAEVKAFNSCIAG